MGVRTGIFLVTLASLLAGAAVRCEESGEEIFEEKNAEARPDADALSFREITPNCELAIERGLAYLAQLQAMQPEGYVGKAEYRIAVTALAGLAFMAGGSTVTTGPYAENVRDATNFFLGLRGAAKDEWEIAAWDDKSRLHGHGYATLFLSQAYGTCGNWHRRDELEEALRESIRLSIRGQEPQGGWGYQARDTLHEGSITVTQLQSLRAARDAGIFVPSSTIERALDYLEKSKIERDEWAYFVYRLGTSSSPSFPLAAAAISSLNAVGKYKTSTVEKGLAFLRRYVPGHSSRTIDLDVRHTQFWYYGQLYAVQAMFQSGGSDWELWFPAIREELIEKQELQRSAGAVQVGYWGRGEAESIYGQAYCTAVACLILQLPYRLLPILQR